MSKGIGLVQIKYDGTDYKYNYGTKVCRSCEGRFTLDMFSKDKSKNDGLRRICKTCDSIGSQIRKGTYKLSKSVKSQLSNTETKQATLDFIFGKSEENPIKRI